mmetsp:Transcript_97064/g.202810  ORF Transcript_97064/g.202810 Transcript_97064/m.202810 type:complete len:376 (-) Transcript_97064:87-1214(-)
MVLPVGPGPEPTSDDLAHLSHDPALATKIMRKRQEEMARRIKLQDPRRRQFGVDHAVLDAQIAEKRAMAKDEAAEDDHYAALGIAQDQILSAIETLRDQNQRQRQKEHLDFSLANLSKEQRREYSLSCPKAYTSAYTTAPDDQLGASSMTKFQGAEVNWEEKRRQKQATADWLHEQMAEKQEREEAEKEWHRWHDEKAFEASQVCASCELATLQEMKEDKEQEARDNLEMAAAKRKQLDEKKRQEALEAKMHADNVRNSDLLVEPHDYKVGSTGKLLKGEYKRVTIEEEADVYNTNAHLFIQKRDQERQEAEMARQDHHRTLQVVSVLGAVEDEKARQTKARQMQIMAENRKAAEQRRAGAAEEHRKYLSFDYEP